MKSLRERSGKIDSTDPLVSFLYILMRDHILVGEVEEIMLHHVDYGNSQFTNGWLAQYCIDVANRLK